MQLFVCNYLFVIICLFVIVCLQLFVCIVAVCLLFFVCLCLFVVVCLSVCIFCLHLSVCISLYICLPVRLFCWLLVSNYFICLFVCLFVCLYFLFVCHCLLFVCNCLFEFGCRFDCFLGVYILPVCSVVHSQSHACSFRDVLVQLVSVLVPRVSRRVCSSWPCVRVVIIPLARAGCDRAFFELKSRSSLTTIPRARLVPQLHQQMGNR